MKNYKTTYMNKFDKNNIDIEKLFTYLLLLAVYAISIKEMYGIHYTTADDVVAELYQKYYTLEEAIIICFLVILYYCYNFANVEFATILYHAYQLS